jgi:tryptophan synthase alpha chain
VAAVEAVLGAARAAARPILVTYLTGGIREDWADLLAAMIDAGADAVEIGLPFSDPMLDGPVIQEASAAAIARGATFSSILGRLRETAWDVPLIAMTYANHAYCRGLASYCGALASAGIGGTIIPDLPVGEAGDYLSAAAGAGLDATLMVTPATGERQIQLIAGRSRGFLYAMSVMATTGPAHGRDDASGWAVADVARRHSPRPVLIGFGVDTPARAAAAASHADGVIVASALIRQVLGGATAGDISRAVAALRRALDAGAG